MPKNHFNELEFTKILKDVNSDPENVKISLEAYLEKYPEDYRAQAIYVSVLITLRHFNEARILLDSLERKFSSDETISDEFRKKVYDEESIFYSRIRLLCYTGKIKRLYEFLLANKEKLRKANEEGLIIYCQKQLGLLKGANRADYHYLGRQIIKYREGDMLRHVKFHSANYNSEQENPKSAVFSSDFPLDKVVEEVKKYIPSDKRLCFGVMADWYYFKYDCCGKEDYKTTNYFKVVCLQNTKKIITMCPILKADKLPHIDLNYLNQSTNDLPKVKKISQIDKFNRRYKKD